MINKNAPIIPGFSIGKIELGVCIDNLEVDFTFKSTYFDKSFYIVDDSIHICVDNKLRSILSISAHEGYTGLLYAKYTIGMPIKFLLDSDMWRFDNTLWDGVMLPINGDKVYVASIEDPDFDELYEKNIECITVFK